MPISFLQPLSRAWTRMKTILFRPFDVRKWLVIAFCVWVAGLLDGTGGHGLGRHPVRGGVRGFDPAVVVRGFQDGWSAIDRAFHHVMGLGPLIVVLGFAIPFALGTLLLLVWLTSRFKFAFLDNLVKNRAAVGEPWRRLGALGDSLFVWRMGFGAAVLVSAIALTLVFGGLGGLGILAGHARSPVAIPLIVIGVLVAIAFALALAYAWLFLESFVVPIMYRFNLTATAAWQYFLRWFSTDSVQFLLYGLFIVALMVPIVIGIVIVGFATCCVGFLLLALPYVGVLLLLPLHVTYRLLGPEFLAQFDPRFDLFGGGAGPQG